MRVLVLFEYPRLNGAERSMLAVIQWLHDESIEWLALCPSGSPVETAAQQAGATTVELPTFTGAERLATLRSFLAQQINALCPDLVHANSLSMSRVLGPVAKELKVPAVGHLRDIMRLSKRAMDDVNLLSQVIAVSQAVAEFHQDQGLANDFARVIHNGVDTTLFRPAVGAERRYLHELLKIPDNGLLIGGIGQLGMRKGWDILLSAFEKYDLANKAYCLIVGEQSSFKEESNAFVAKLKSRAAMFGDRVRLLGRRDDVPKLLRSLSVLAHPARQEPLGRVLLEAAATGLPVVATQVGGTEEIFSPPEKTAILVDPGDPVAMAAEISRLLNDVVLRQQVGSAARCKMKSHFNIQRCAQATWSIYQQFAQ